MLRDERERDYALYTRGYQNRINVDTATTPQRLQYEAEAAAHSGDLHTQVSVPGRAIHAIPLWKELRTWDPGD